MSEWTQGVGSTFGMMMSWVVISFSWASIHSFASVGTLCLPSCTGGTFGLPLILYVSGVIKFDFLL